MPLYFRQCLYCTLSLSHVFGESYPCAYKDKITFARGSFWISVSRFLQHKNAKPGLFWFFFSLLVFFGFLELTGSNLGTFSATIISNIHSEIFFYVFLLLIQLDVYFKQLFHSCFYSDIFILLLSIYFREEYFYWHILKLTNYIQPVNEGIHGIFSFLLLSFLIFRVSFEYFLLFPFLSYHYFTGFFSIFFIFVGCLMN